MTEITLDFLQNLLKEDYPYVIIQHFQGAPGSKQGDNYTSMVYRITLTGTKRRTEPHNSEETEEPWHNSIIYKCLPESTLRREAFKSDELFCNEVAFYNKIWPCLFSFQEQWEVHNPFRAIPKCYLARNDCVVLKDLKQQGFVMPDRRQGLNLEQCYFVLKHLSQFHALSLAMKCHDPEAFYDLLNVKDGITEVFFVKENDDYYKNYYRQATYNAISMVEQELSGSEGSELYLSKFKQFCSEETFFSSMVELVAPREPLAVICHGDCWTNNFLFRYFDEEITEMFLVDFQLARYASPALDLVYIMYLCLDRQQRAQHQASLLEYYTDELHKRLVEMSETDSVFHNTLNKDALHELVNDCRRSTWLGGWSGITVQSLVHDRLQEEFKRSGRFGLGVALDMYPIMTCDSEEAPNLYQHEESESSSASEVQPVRTLNAACRRKMTELVTELVDHGIL